MSEQTQYESIESFSGTPIKSVTRGVPFAENARRQVENVASLPFIHGWVAVMPDVHWGMGATVGSVIPTVGAPFHAVGVDIGCGMMALQTTLTADDLPDNLSGIRSWIERSSTWTAIRAADGAIAVLGKASQIGVERACE